MLRYGLALAIVASGCGGGGALVIVPDGELVAIEASNATLENAFVTAASNGRHLAVAWVRSDEFGSFELVGDLLDEDLNLVDDPTVLSSNETEVPIDPYLCAEVDAFGVVWASTLPSDDIPLGVTLDTANVFTIASWDAAGDVSDPERVNQNTIGEQRRSSIACLPDGGRLVSWTSECVAVERIDALTTVHFRPAECDAEPADGTYIQALDANGVAVAQMAQISSSRTRRTPMEALQNGHVVLILPTSIQIRSDVGELAAEEPTGGIDLSEGDLACGAEQCATAIEDESLEVWLFDVVPLASPVGVLVQETTQVSPTERIRPVDPHIACSPEGMCLVTWLLQREIQDGDAISFESLGVFGRALDMHSQRLGTAAMLDSAPESTEGAEVEWLRDNVFATIRAVERNIEIRPFRVE